MKDYLLTPGPTPVPEEIMRIMAKPIIHHRTPEYKEFFKKATEDLKAVFKTKGDVLMFTASGTGAMEASVVNTLSPGDKAVVVRGGKFGERFYEICASYGVEPIPIETAWGSAPAPEAIKGVLDKDKDIKAVYVNLCETSTGTAYPIKLIGDVVKNTGAILVVDVISGLGADEFCMDDWHVDVAVGGSQKGLMLPPGLSFCGISQKAWDLIKKAKLPRYYFDFAKYKKSLEKLDPPFTPAITLVIGLAHALSMIKKEGVDNYIKRHALDASFMRESVKKMGLELYSESPSDAVTAVKVPDGVDGQALVKALKAKGVTVAGGQSQLKGKIFRIAHMGGIGRGDLEFALGKLKEVLTEMGHGG